MIERISFLPAAMRDSAAVEEALLMPSADYSISQTATVDLMIQSLDVKPQMRVLDVGSGTGYHAARIAELGAVVHSVERLMHAAEHAAQNLRSQGFNEVSVTVGDGFAGLPGHAPFDRINIACAATGFPLELFRQLRVGGVMVYPAAIAGTDCGTYPDILLRVQKLKEFPATPERHSIDAAMRVDQLGAVYFMRATSDQMPSTPDRAEFFGGVAFDASRSRPEIGFVELTHRKGEGPPLHFHRFEDERFQVSEGRFEFRSGERQFILEQGQSCLIPRNVPHKYRALGEQSNRLFISLTPGSAERYFLEMRSYWERSDANFDGSNRLNNEYGMILLQSSAEAKEHF